MVRLTTLTATDQRDQADTGVQDGQGDWRMHSQNAAPGLVWSL